jgi:regulator of sigma E protease
MSKTKGSLKHFRTSLWVVVLAAIVYFAAQNIGAFGNVLLVALGFGAVVLVHEFGHFIVAKLSGIKVEAFSIFMPPILLGVKKTENGFRFRILPKLFPKKDEQAGETEYRIGLIPFGGFVKMLGQDDTGPVKENDDPRSFANKPIGVRAAVIAAGVFFNVISAVMIFMIAFLIGIKLPPAVVGGVTPGSPAALAGLKAGDEIIEIAGKSDNLDFSDIAMRAALSGKDEKIALKVKHEDGSIEDFAIAAEQKQTSMGTIKVFGIVPAQSLTIAEVSDADGLFERIGLRAGDRIISVDGRSVQRHWEMERIVQDALVPTVTVLAERGDELIESQIRLGLSPARSNDVNSESKLCHIYSMVPRLLVTVVSDERNSTRLRRADTGLKRGDIILAVGEVENPTYKEMRETTTEYEGKKLPIKVLREGSKEAVTVVPERAADSNQVLIGIGVALDAEHPIVAGTVSVEGLGELAIPRGAAITAVDGISVSSVYDVIRQIRDSAGERITINWRLDNETAGDFALNVGRPEDFITVKSTFAEFVPFKDLKQLYKASGPVDAIGMGYKKTIMFIAQTYVTIKRLIGGLISPKQLMGPVGILTFSYRIVAEQPFIYYVYFLGLISACIAVFNFLPLPPLDGGLIVLLLVEKVKGSALSEKTQGFIAYAGWVLIGTLFLYVTFNDIVRSFFG